MTSFTNNRLLREPIPMHIVNLIAKINEYKGREQLYHEQSPDILAALRQVAVVESTESSTRIEGVNVPERQVKAIVLDRVLPQNRSEGEVAGYRDVLEQIHAANQHIPVTPNTILQLHRDLYVYVAAEGGKWKPADNTIDDVMPDGSRRVRFRPVPAFRTPQAVEELCADLHRHESAEDVTPVLLAASFVLDFLCIHPFRDGNGRMSRLLTLLLLYQRGYEVGRYISLERLIEQTKESYYDALALSSDGWHEGAHQLIPWWEYMLGILIAAYREFETRVGNVEAGRGVKAQHVRRTASNMVGDFSITELSRLCPHVSRDTIRSVLEQMRSEGIVECLGRGRSARWRKRPDAVA